MVSLTFFGCRCGVKFDEITENEYITKFRILDDL